MCCCGIFLIMIKFNQILTFSWRFIPIMHFWIWSRNLIFYRQPQYLRSNVSDLHPVERKDEIIIKLICTFFLRTWDCKLSRAAVNKWRSTKHLLWTETSGKNCSPPPSLLWVQPSRCRSEEEEDSNSQNLLTFSILMKGGELEDSGRVCRTVLASGRKLTKGAIDATTFTTISMSNTDVWKISTSSNRSSKHSRWGRY